MKEGVADKVRAAGGELYAISSEPQALSDRAAHEWSLGFEAVGDPHQEISDTCCERGWLDLFVNERLEFLQASADASDWSVSHPKGYFQPGVLALDANGRVLYRWRSIPSRKNIGGAVERPTAEHVWTEIASALETGADTPDALLDADPPLDSKGIEWPLFAALLVANGWFMNARGFKSPKHAAYAALRLLGFVGAWVAAFAWLPTLPVAAALVAWGIYIAPKVRWVGKEFQNVGPSSV